MENTQEFTYKLENISAKEAQFILEAISSVSVPLVLSGPIYSKIQAQIVEQNQTQSGLQNPSDSTGTQAKAPAKPYVRRRKK